MTSSICGFGWNNAILNATSFATDQTTPVLPISNLQNDYGAASYGYQSSNTTLDIIAYFPVQTVRVVSVHRTNLTNAATCWITLYNAGNLVASYGTNGNNQPMSVENNQFVYIFPNDIAADTIEIELYDPNNPQGFINVPLCYVGPLWQPNRNMSFDSTEGANTGIDEMTSLSGVEMPNTRWVQRSYTVDHQSLDLTDMVTVRKLRSWGLRTRNVLFIPNPSLGLDLVNTASIYGRLAPGDIKNPFGAAMRQQTTFTMTERL